MIPSALPKATSILIIQGGRIIDPSRSLDISGNVCIADGRIAFVGKGEGMIRQGDGEGCVPAGTRVLVAKGLVVCPGFVDLHCHLREPGFEEKETIATGTAAAARGGFTTVCCMPNTDPPLDSEAAVAYVREKARGEGLVKVLVIGCVTKARKGQELAEMGELAMAGVVAFSDDGNPVADAGLMRHAMEYSRLFGLPIIDHCEELALSRGGVMNEGLVSAALGLRGIPSAAEEIAVARDVALAAFTGARVHIAHVSSANAVDIIRRAKQRGVAITAEVTPHHLTLTEQAVLGAGKPGQSMSLAASSYFDTNAKVNPPLRTEEDREALIRGLEDGTLDAVATDHAPHTVVDKLCEFDIAAFGISGLETALGSLMGLVEQGKLPLITVLSKLTTGPARILGKEHEMGCLKEGCPADITIFDPERKWVVRPEEFASKGKNTPLAGRELKGRVVATISGGKVVYKDDSLEIANSIHRSGERG